MHYQRPKTPTNFSGIQNLRFITGISVKILACSTVYRIGTEKVKFLRKSKYVAQRVLYSMYIIKVNEKVEGRVYTVVFLPPMKPVQFCLCTGRP